VKKAAALALFFWVCMAQSSEENLASIFASIETPRDVPVPYVELRMTPLFAEPVELSGYVEFDQAGVLTKAILEPFQELVSISESELRVSRGTEEESFPVKKGGDIWFIYMSLRDLLDGNLEGIENYYTVTSKRDGDDWELLLLPISGRAQAQIKSMTVNGSGGILESIRIVYGLNNWQEFSFAVVRNSGGVE
jgi:hypothetical protein